MKCFNFKRGMALATAALFFALASATSAQRVVAEGAAASRTEAGVQTQWRGDYFPNIVLRDQDGRNVRFYDDMIRGKVVSINFIYTTCTDLCPLDTAQLRQVQQLLGERLGRDVFMYSISVNSDSPEALRRYMRTYDVGPNWRFLTGSQADVTRLQRLLGLRVIDPNDLRGHSSSIVLGNEINAQWIKRSAYENPRNIVELLTVFLQSSAPDSSRRGQSYAAAGQMLEFARRIFVPHALRVLSHDRRGRAAGAGFGGRGGVAAAGVAVALDPRTQPHDRRARSHRAGADGALPQFADAQSRLERDRCGGADRAHAQRGRPPRCGPPRPLNAFGTRLFADAAGYW